MTEGAESSENLVYLGNDCNTVRSKVMGTRAQLRRTLRSDMVAHTCSPSWEGQGRGMAGSRLALAI